MKISEAANRTKVPIKKIRYYSDIGLITPSRVNNGYRDFTENDLKKTSINSKIKIFWFFYKRVFNVNKII